MLFVTGFLASWKSLKILSFSAKSLKVLESLAMSLNLKKSLGKSLNFLDPQMINFIIYKKCKNSNFLFFHIHLFSFSFRWKMKKAKQTYFNSLWLSDIDYASWLQRADKNTSFFCKLCKKERELGTMGEGALKSHVKGDKHTELVKAEKLKKPFFKPRHGDRETQSSSSSQPSQSPLESGEKEETEKETSAGQQNICKFVAKASSAEAEIRWTLFCVKHNFSDNSQDGFVPIVQKMFPDSKIAASLRLGPDKIGKVVKFGLYPYFKSLVLDKILKSPKFVVSFDESLNNVTQTTQMDINIRYFDFDLMKVVEIYWHSNFLGTAAAVDLLKSFEDALEKLDITKMIQVGMDGPSVNWSFVEKLKSSRDNI